MPPVIRWKGSYDMKVMVTGASGLLGWEIADALEAAGHQAVRLMGRKMVSVTDPRALGEFAAAQKPDAIVHAAGYRDLDDMEAHPKEGYALNAFGARCAALAARRVGAKLLLVSSDTVFDGEKEGGYHEYDEPRPVNVYGKSKLAAEREVQSLWDRHFILRTALLFGYKGHRENNFIYNIVDRLRAGETVKASTEQICCPSYTGDLAAALIPMLESEAYGLYHVANSGAASRWDVSRAVAEEAELDADLVLPMASDEKRRAKRAKNTVFDSIAYPLTFGGPLPDWREALCRCMAGALAEEGK